MRVEIDHARAADLGVSAQEIGRTLETMMGGRRVTTYVDGGEEYDVIMQAQRSDRAAPADLDNLYVRSARSGELIPLANLVSLKELAEPGRLNRFNRLRGITISAALAPGYTLGEALDWAQKAVAEELHMLVRSGRMRDCWDLPPDEVFALVGVGAGLYAEDWAHIDWYGPLEIWRGPACRCTGATRGAGGSTTRRTPKALA